MEYVNLLKKILNITVISILLFFSISFLDFLTQIPPFKEERIDLKLGVPFTFFNELYLRDGFNHSWNLLNLINDCAIVWFGVIISSLIKSSSKK
jgi:hypothetical protein